MAGKAGNIFLKRLRVSGLLSFGPQGVDLPMRSLNVLIGPNGSGKSNLIEVLSLLRAAPRNLAEPVKASGGVREWLWKGQDSRDEAEIDVVVGNPKKRAMDLRHVFSFREHGTRFEVTDERIENESSYADRNGNPYFYYRYQRGHPVILELRDKERKLKREQVRPEESILSQLRDPERYPVLGRFQEGYSAIRLFRNWSFGPAAAVRREQSPLGSSDFLDDNGDNLVLVLQSLRSTSKSELKEHLRQLYDGVEDINVTFPGGGTVQLTVEESGGRSIPASRLSDGTLRYLCLLAVLLHPQPPPLIAIEEPELGLHPDLIHKVAQMLVEASRRTQLVVTTHSRLLVDALADEPESIIVCEKENGSSSLKRIERKDWDAWLQRYSPGELWSSGEFGGNRW